jgi:hypothetical protein
MTYIKVIHKYLILREGSLNMSEYHLTTYQEIKPKAHLYRCHIEATKRNPMDGTDDGARGFHLSA